MGVGHCVTDPKWLLYNTMIDCTVHMCGGTGPLHVYVSHCHA